MNDIYRMYDVYGPDDIKESREAEYQELRWETLKSQLFDWGRDYIEEFLGQELDYGWEKDTVDNLLDEVWEQMPEEELEVFMQKFCVDEILEKRAAEMLFD